MFRPLSASIRRATAADHAVALGVAGLLTKPLLGNSKMLDPTECSSASSSAVLILEPCSSLRWFIDSQVCCGDFGVPARSKPAYLTSRPNFCARRGGTPPADPANRGLPELRLKPMVTR